MPLAAAPRTICARKAGPARARACVARPPPGGSGLPPGAPAAEVRNRSRVLHTGTGGGPRAKIVCGPTAAGTPAARFRGGGLRRMAASARGRQPPCA